MKTSQRKGSRGQLVDLLTRRPQELLSYLSSWSSFEDFWSGEGLRWLWRDAEQFVELRDDMWAAASLPGESPQASSWWPRGGPQWDGVAMIPSRTTEPCVLLVEAKSHVEELESSIGATGQSKATIEAALNEVRGALGVGEGSDWTRGHYQYANRLAWLYYLRRHAGVNAWLLFVYFTGDHFESWPPRGRVFPASADNWLDPVIAVRRHLGLPERHPLSPWTRSVFVPARSEAMSTDS